MKYGYIEKRFLSADSLRRACITYGWYTAGNNAEYSRLLESVESKVITTDDIVEIATDIIEHSVNLSVDNIDSVMYIIGSICFTLFEEA